MISSNIQKHCDVIWFPYFLLAQRFQRKIFFFKGSRNNIYICHMYIYVHRTFVSLIQILTGRDQKFTFHLSSERSFVFSMCVLSFFFPRFFFFFFLGISFLLLIKILNPLFLYLIGNQTLQYKMPLCLITPITYKNITL